MRVEIVAMDMTLGAMVRVTDESTGEAVVFRCKASNPAHEALVFAVRNAARELGAKAAEKHMASFTRGFREA